MPATHLKDSLFILMAVASALSLDPARGAGQAPAPSARNLECMWQVLNSAAWNLEDHAGATGVPAGKSVVEGGSIPYQPWALAKRKENFANRKTADPEA